MDRSPNYCILAIDPGYTCGWAILGPEGRFTSDECSYESMTENLWDTADWMARYVPWFAITSERANVNNNKGGRGILRSLKWEMGLNGIAEFAARRYKHQHAEYNKSDALHSASDEVLKKLGWWHDSSAGHARDAARILVCALQQFDLDYWRMLVIDKDILRD